MNSSALLNGGSAWADTAGLSENFHEHHLRAYNSGNEGEEGEEESGHDREEAVGIADHKVKSSGVTGSEADPSQQSAG
jgi:hypothetical protein